MSGDEIDSVVIHDGTVVEKTRGHERERFGRGQPGSGKIKTGRTGSFGDEDDGLVVIEELGIEIERDTVSEAVLWAESGVLLGLGLELEREDVEAIVGPTDCAEDEWEH